MELHLGDAEWRRAASPAALDGTTLTIRGNEYEVNVGGKTDKGTCTLDDRAAPKRLTVQGTEGPNVGKTFLAIYEFPDESSMRVCYDLSGGNFPAAFESTAGSQLYLVVYQRQEPASTTVTNNRAAGSLDY